MTLTFMKRPVRALFIASLFIVLQAGQVYAAQPDQAEAATVTGELELLYLDDFENKRAELQYFIRDKQSNKRYRLEFEGTPPGHLRTGMPVTAKGKAVGRQLFLAADGVSQSSSPSPAQTLPAITGDQRTLVMVGNFKDAAVSCSVDQIRDTMFTDPSGYHVDALYQEMSHGQVGLSGDVTGPYTLDYRSTDSCDLAYYDWADALDTAAINQGYDLSSYSRRIYVLPSNNTCGWAGLGTVGGNPSASWVMECDIEGVYAHELGHNIGMHHAGTGWYAYGDTSDIMGASGPLYKINAPHHDQMGWLPDSQILEVTESGTYDIASLGTDPAQSPVPQMLKIVKPDTPDFYYVSFRQPLGFDRNMSTTYQGRTSIHTYKGDDSSNMTDLRGTLGDGESYTDTVNGWTFTQLSHREDYATVRVDLGDLPPPVCTAAAPDVSVSPSSQSAEAGTSLGYTITIRNNDDSNCDSSSFNLASVVPAGWSAGLSKSSLSLAPGATGYASLTVTASSSANAKSYGIQIEVSDSSESLHTASANATYTVLESCNITPPTLTLSQTSQSADAGGTLSYAYSLRNNDSSACGTSTFDLVHSLPDGWSGSLTSSRITLSAGATLNGNLQVTSAASAQAGSYSVGLQATDSATSGHNASATSTYIVNEPAPVCTPAAPGVSITPASQSAEAGNSLAYTVTIRNNDDSNCGLSRFNLASVVPAGWSAGLSKSSLSLGPGATGSTGMTVTSSSSASPGSFGIQIKVSDSSESMHAASATAAYTVLESCIVNAPTLTVSQTSQSADAGGTLSYAFSLRNNDGSACGSSTFALTRLLPSGWSGSVSPATITLSPGFSKNGTLQVTSSGSAAAGSYSVGLQVNDSSTSGHNASATSTYIVNEPAPVCTPAAPGLNITPASQSAEAGNALNYTVTIRNNDDSNCGLSSFNLASVVSSGLSAGISTPSLSIAPGKTGSATLTVVSSASANAGPYGIQVKISDSSESLHTGSANATYTVLESCIVNAPTLTLSQSSQSADAGGTLSYAFTLRNNDSVCGDSTFDLNRSLPSGWNGTVTPARITLAAGNSTTGTLQVTSAASAQAGSYSVGLQVTDTSTSVHTASATTTYVVNEPVDILDTQAPTMPTGLAASANFKQVSLTWNPSSDNVAVSGYRVWRGGVNIAYTTDTSYTDTTGMDGMDYVYRVSAMDLAGNESAQSAPVTSGKTVRTKGGGKSTSDGSTDGGTTGDTTTKTNKGKGNNK